MVSQPGKQTTAIQISNISGSKDNQTMRFLSDLF